MADFMFANTEIGEVRFAQMQADAERARWQRFLRYLGPGTRAMVEEAERRRIDLEKNLRAAMLESDRYACQEAAVRVRDNVQTVAEEQRFIRQEFARFLANEPLLPIPVKQ